MSLTARCKREGSPPQVRGKPIAEQYGEKESEDHPRRCGENENEDISRKCWKGSPPQVRGKLLLFLHLGKRNRITPAGAGKTYVSIISPVFV